MEASNNDEYEPYEPEEELDYEPKPDTPEPRYVKPSAPEPRYVKPNKPEPRYVFIFSVLLISMKV